MPSTYISLLLCGLMFIFYSNHRRSALRTKPALVRPVVRGNKPMVKKTLPVDATDVYLSKNQNHDNKQDQIGLRENGFSFFKDVISHIAPALKNLK